MTPEATERATVEWRVCWTASTNISFKGSSDWTPWEEDEPVTVEEVEAALEQGQSGGWSLAFETVIQASGFEWWTEVREVDAPSGTPS